MKFQSQNRSRKFETRKSQSLTMFKRINLPYFEKEFRRKAQYVIQRFLVDVVTITEMVEENDKIHFKNGPHYCQYLKSE